ncbi:hypothetical protein EYF80_042962 [Liparis tanakae]|uniref:Uncharacterized protein n=1 Tax=Liparis tanakae TaxID=230148 RepID=A0A4Z2G2R3_9TELE|nr:hypothetical protein EYF80_042962 [Liparis tanakae]
MSHWIDTVSWLVPHNTSTQQHVDHILYSSIQQHSGCNVDNTVRTRTPVQTSLCRSCEGGEVAIPRGLCGVPLRPEGGRPRAGGRRSAAVMTPVVLLSAVVAVCVGGAVRNEVLRGPGDAAAGQTHVPAPVEGEIPQGRRRRVGRWCFSFPLFLRTLDVRRLAPRRLAPRRLAPRRLAPRRLCRLSDRSHAVYRGTTFL